MRHETYRKILPKSQSRRKSQRLRWAGHVERMSGDGTPKIMNVEVPVEANQRKTEEEVEDWIRTGRNKDQRRTV